MLRTFLLEIAEREGYEPLMTAFLKNHYDKIIAIVRNTATTDQEDKNNIFIIN